jgi:tetratricopeptide (TPR) repeat protein
VYRFKNELFAPAVGLSLVLAFGLVMDGFFSESDRQSYPVVHLDIEDGVDRSYRGTYARDPRFRPLVRNLAPLRVRALREAQERIGLTCYEPERFVVRFKDYPRTSHFGASSRPVRAETGDVHLVTLSAEQFVVGVMNVHDSLVHEFIHCVMREKMGDRAYLSLERWIREGIAVWGADQLRELSRNVIADAFLANRDVLSVQREFERLLDKRGNYLMDALLFEYIQVNHGEDAVRFLISEIVAGVDFIQAFERATGLDWHQLMFHRDQFARMHFEVILVASGLQEFQAAQRLHRLGNGAAAIERLYALVQKRPDSLLTPKAWYWIGKWEAEQQQYDLAAEAFATVVYLFSDHLGLQDDSRYRLAECYSRMSRYTEALEELNRFFQDHPSASSELRGDARFFAGYNYYRLGNYRTAVPFLRLATRTSPNHDHEAYYYLSLAYLFAGENFNSKLALAELAYRYPCSERLDRLRAQIDRHQRVDKAGGSETLALNDGL